MEYVDYIKTIVSQPSVLRRFQPILLLSHMRANTSLIGHILGSHPEVEGYYEMHIGYHSWKSFLRQKLLYSHDHKLKSSARYIFDKVLHNEHRVSTELLNDKKCKVLVALRRPESTIPSILKLYQRVDPDHEFSSLFGACTYYEERLLMLKRLVSELDDYCYYDSEDLRGDTESCLALITDYLELSSILNNNFETKKFTGVGSKGDLSGNLSAGKVKRFTSDYSNFEIPSTYKDRVESTYNNVRQALIRGASYSL